MTKEQTIKQIHLCADILSHDHPWEWKDTSGTWIAQQFGCLDLTNRGHEIRLALATPGDGRSLHNPDGLTAEQVGAGWRLCLAIEETNTHADLQEYWIEDEAIWKKSGKCTRGDFGSCRYTYRLPLSTPWPEAPKVDSWKLPEPPAGKRWHRDGWRKEMLPPGYRPLLADEIVVRGQGGDEFIGGWEADDARVSDLFHWQHKDGEKRTPSSHGFWRTKRPLPVEPVLVALSAGDVPPGSVFRTNEHPEYWFSPLRVTPCGCNFMNDVHGSQVFRRWNCLQRNHQINRSIPLTGKWDANAWEACSKPAP